MGAKITNIAVIALMLVGIADLVIPSHVEGTKALGNVIIQGWRSTVNGALGQTT